MKRIGVFGWGIVAPKSANIEAFEKNLDSAESWLTPFNGFGPDTFLVGQPELDFEDYRPWLAERFPAGRFRQITSKMGTPVLHAIASFIQALGQNPGLEAELKRLDTKTHVYVGTGMGDLATVHESSIALYHAQRRWDRFWSAPERNAVFRAWQGTGRPARPDLPVDPATVGIDERDTTESRWWAYWAAQSPELHEYLAALRRIEAANVVGDIERGKMSLLKQKQRLIDQLQAEWSAPEPPWKAVSANVIWNIHNAAASQISMLGDFHGLSYAPIGACAGFGLSLKLGMDAIQRGEATAVVVGSTEPAPHPLIVGGMYTGRILAADSEVSKPLHGLRGTHISGGAVIWILGDWDHMTSLGFTPLGMEPLAVGVSNDAHHIITPSKEGPVLSIEAALERADVKAADVTSWDLHATATPGDYLEVENLRDVLPKSVLVTARKGTFGHGMAAGGGWELTAQYLGFMRGRLHPTPLTEAELHPSIAELHRLFVFDEAVEVRPGLAGKLSMGVGGVNACVISKPLP